MVPSGAAVADGELTHVDDEGRVRMVDVSGKTVTRRIAVASCVVRMTPATVERLDDLAKGDALAVARIAGIQGAKRTAELVPLCHPLPLESVEIGLETGDGSVRIRSRVVTTGRTGAEMEALVACATAALALYDMVKSVERDAEIDELRLEEKRGGSSGDFVRGSS